jgi:FkbM family methyltransferase
MKAAIRHWLQRKGLYFHIKYSCLFRLYEELFKPSVIREHHKEVDLYRSFLPECRLIFDIGAYDGHKTAAFLELSEKVVCCEPDMYNFRLLKTRFRRYKGRRVHTEPFAVSGEIAERDYYTHHEGSAFNTLNPRWKDILERDGLNRWHEEISFPGKPRKLLTTTLDSLIEKYGRPDFIKIDAEGSEFGILEGLSKQVRFLSFECLLPEFKDDLEKCIARLRQLDNDTEFNVIFEEQLVLQEFVDFEGISGWIRKATSGCFEILARMQMNVPVTSPAGIH